MINYKKYNNFEEIIEGDEVKINSNGDWNQIFGVIENINCVNKRAEIFSMQFPDTRYIVREDNLGNIEKIVEDIHR